MDGYGRNTIDVVSYLIRSSSLGSVGRTRGHGTARSGDAVSSRRRGTDVITVGGHAASRSGENSSSDGLRSRGQEGGGSVDKGKKGKARNLHGGNKRLFVGLFATVACEFVSNRFCERTLLYPRMFDQILGLDSTFRSCFEMIPSTLQTRIAMVNQLLWSRNCLWFGQTR